MTVVTIPYSEKSDKLDTPLVINEQINDVDAKIDLEASTDPEPQFLILRAQARRVSSATTTCLFLTALLMMSIGIIGGVYLYHQFARVNRFRGWCSIPYDATKATMYMDNRNFINQHSGSLLADSDLFKSLSSDPDADLLGDDSNSVPDFFKEEFEIDLENENYEKIDVPDFRGGRRGRFIHDFNSNKTGIVDVDGHRCFVMPLNRRRVLPPRSMFDLISKMWEGYYEVDTDVVRETMRVVTPPISDLKTVGVFIGRECKGLPTYMLEKVVSGVFKRSLDEGATFAEFAGKKIVKLLIINLPETVPEPIALAGKKSFESENN